MNQFTLLLLLGMAPLVQAADLEFYKEGAICDRKSGFCADHMGVSVGLTKLYLGEKAERNLMAEINKVGIQAFNATTFTMSSGLTCDTREKKCYSGKERSRLDLKAMRVLFKAVKEK